MNFGTVNSIDEEFQLNYNVYPNPSNGKFTIDNLTNDTYDLIVNNIYGQQVLEEKQIVNVKKEIDLCLFSSGIYIVEIKSKNNNFTHKLLLE
jgi:restriction endonuclease S subunit